MSTTTPSLTLYRSDGACSLVPHILLHELGIPLTEVKMTYSPAIDGLIPQDTSILSGAEYRSQISAAGMVPALKIDDNTVITEMAGVLTYIAALAEESGRGGWIPKDGVLRARAYEWISWSSGTVHGQGFTGLWRPGRFSGEESALDGIREKGRKAALGNYEGIEARLAKNVAAGGDGGGRRGFAVGGEFTVVDVLVYLFWRWARHVDLEEGMEGRWPLFAEVARRVEGMEGTKVAMEIEGLELWFS